MALRYVLHVSSDDKGMSFAAVMQPASKAAHAVPGMAGKHGMLLWAHCKTAGHPSNCMELRVECTPAHVASFTEKLVADNLTCVAVQGPRVDSSASSSSSSSSDEDPSSEDEPYEYSSSSSESSEEEEEEPPHKRRRLDTQRWMDDIGRITVAELVAQAPDVRAGMIDLALAIAASKKNAAD
jgi:hypothetical protein